MSSSSHKISSASSGVTSRGNLRRRGMPPMCRCGEASIIKTSGTVKNPGRLFHCCPYGSEFDNYHLFRWTDECMVEEIEDLKEIVGEIRGELVALRESVVACETEAKVSEVIVSSYGQKINGYEKDMETMKSMLTSYEKEVQKMIGEKQSLKNIMVCVFVLIAIVVYFSV